MWFTDTESTIEDPMGTALTDDWSSWITRIVVVAYIVGILVIAGISGYNNAF